MKTSSAEKTRNPSGYTIIDVLVALSALSLLLALLMPVIQRSRESSRNLTCQNNLKQLVTAAHGYEAVHQEFPYTSKRYVDRDNGGLVRPSISPHAKMLSFLDEPTLADEIDFKYADLDRPDHLPECYAANPRTGWQDFKQPILQNVLATTVDVFLCPSDSRYRGGSNYRACMGTGAGTLEKRVSRRYYCEGSGTGAFVHRRGTRVSEFRDGLANTVMFSESLIGDLDPSHYTPWRDVFFSRSAGGLTLCGPDSAANHCQQYAQAHTDHDSYTGTTWLFGGWRHTWYNHVLTPNARTPDCSQPSVQGGGWGAYSARSFHSGSVNLALGDGVVRSCHSEIDLLVWRSLATRDGGEVAMSD